MHGITTIHKLNREAAEAAAIMAKHAASDAAKRAANGEPVKQTNSPNPLSA